MTDTPNDHRDEHDADEDDVGPLEGLLDPEDGPNTPAGDAEAPPPG